jgi:large subunit ribosomal protein L9
MEIILQQDYPSLGYVGDRVKVRAGYARNYLIPHGIALESSVHNEKVLKHKLGGVNARKIKLRAEAQQFGERLQTVTLDFFLRAGGSGKTFGSVTVKDIEASLKKEGFVLDKKQITLVEPIKKAGDHKVQIKLHSEVTVEVAVRVTTEVVEVPKAEGEERPEGRRGRGRRKAAKPESESDENQAVTEEGAISEQQAADDKPAKQGRKQKKGAESGEGEASAASKTESAE